MSGYWFINIAAMSKNGYIGKDNKLPWKLKGEMRHFLDTISKFTIVMGRKTCESLPRKLNDKDHYVITKDKSFYREGFITVNSIEDLLYRLKVNVAPIYVIGGSSIYEQFIKLASERDDIILTNELSVIDMEVEGDAKFPIELLEKEGYVKELISTNVDDGIVWRKYLYYK